MKYDATNPKSEERDIFILSKGHGSLALYSILNESGFFDENYLKSFCKKGSTLGGEPCIPDIPGVEATTGSLGHGLSLGVGMALAKKLDKRKEKIYSQHVINGKASGRKSYGLGLSQLVVRF